MSGPGSTEVVVEIPTREGLEELVVHQRLVEKNRLEVGHVLGKQGKYALVELPRESTSGKWRIWVPDSEILEAA